MKLGTTLAILVFALISIAHLLRIVFAVELVAGGTQIPIWVSVLGCLVPATIAVLLWREGRAVTDASTT